MRGRPTTGAPSRPANISSLQLTRICTLAAATRFYGKIFKEAGFNPQDLKALEDIRQLPTINKETAIDHHDEMLTVPLGSPGVDTVSTGGTSGRRMYFQVPGSRSAIEYSYLIASWERAGYRLGMPMAELRGTHVTADRNGLHHEYDPILRRHLYSSYHNSEKDYWAYFRHIAAIGRCYLHVYPSSIAMLARFMERYETGPLPNVAGILSGSEMVIEEEREQACRVMQCPYFSWYGHSEKLVLAAECEHSRDYHVWPTYGYFELLNERGEACQVGQRGEIAGTGFINHIMPFIRYRTGDFATYKADKCASCGREHILLTKVEGRHLVGGLQALDGSLITLQVIGPRDTDFRVVDDYQFVQSQPGKAVMRIKLNEAISEEKRKELHRMAEEMLQNQISLELESCDKLATTPAGKRIRLIQEGAMAVRS